MGKDIYPQYMRMPRVSETTGGTAVESVAIPTPVEQSSGKVMELLWVDFEMDGGSLQTRDQDSVMERELQITHRSQGTTLIDFSNSALIAKYKDEATIAFPESTETGGAGYALVDTYQFNMQDAKGNGVLFAGVELFILVRGAVGATVLAGSARIAYRLITLSAIEAIGIIQSFS